MGVQTPVFNVLETPVSAGLKSKLFLTDDPALVVLYSQLRQKSLQTLRGASKVTPQVEWAFVMHSARLYDRMGCDLLGLDLGKTWSTPLRCRSRTNPRSTGWVTVRNWEFLKSPGGIARGLGGEIDPIMLVRRRSSLVVADLPLAKGPLEMKAGRGDGNEPPRQPPAVIEEPDPNSFLDSFGF